MEQLIRQGLINTIKNSSTNLQYRKNIMLIFSLEIKKTIELQEIKKNHR